MNKLQLIEFIGMALFYMLGSYFIINIFNTKKDERENIALLKAVKSSIIVIFFLLFITIIFYVGYNIWSVPSGYILLILAIGMLVMILSYKITLSDKAFKISFLDVKNKETKRKLLLHLSEACALISVIFSVLMIIDEIQHPQAKTGNPYVIGLLICIFLQVYISTKIAKKKQSTEDKLKTAKKNRFIVIVTLAIFLLALGASLVTYFILHK
ncbi:MAG: hypothetical protein PHX70_12815 [Clostridium sp.]|nr:hypothetical protein [Clostridium sp.]